MADSQNSSCPEEEQFLYNISLGFTTAVPEWEALLTIFTLTLIIIFTVIGNILVILSVFTHKPLRIVQNFFIVSLAVADMTVAILVLPLNVAYSILGKWVFGIHVCKMWVTSDVMCCTASILNLCAIALDRFWAITDPINYAQKRTLKRVLLMIGGVWVLSLIISSPPLIGWNDWPPPEEFAIQSICRLTERPGYVIYSSLGSFFIPLLIMTIVYVEIFIATRRRLRERAKASKIGAMMSRNQTATNDSVKDRDRESVSSETNHNDPVETNGKSAKDAAKKGNKKNKKNKGKHHNANNDTNDKAACLKPMLVHEDSFTDNAEGSSSSQRKNSLPSATAIDVGNGGGGGDEQHKQIEAAEKTPIPLTASTITPAVVDATQTKKTVKVPEQPKKSGVVYQFIEEKQRISLSKERRAARTLGIIMGVFVVCWLPFFLMYVIKPFCPSCCASNRLINFITWLGYINSALNPIIYTIFNLDFRRAFKKLLGLKV